LDTLHLATDVVVGLNELVKSDSPGKQWLGDERWKDKLESAVQAELSAKDGDQSVLIASLQSKVEALQAEIERLEEELPTDTSPAPEQEVTGRLSDPIVFLQAQSRALQRELSGTTASTKSEGGDQFALLADMDAQTEALSEDRGEIQGEVETTPAIEGAGAEGLIASLRATISDLQQEIQWLKDQLSISTREPGPREVGRPPIQDLIDKLHKHEAKRYETRPRSAIKTLVIHHSAAPPGVGPQQVAAYHVNRLDWPGAGYHFLVATEGTIYQANSIETVSYHAAKANSRSVGICFLGDFSQEIPPPPQLLAGAHLVAWLMQELNIDLDEVKGHKELMGTACPGIQWLEGKNWKQMLHQEIIQIQQTGQPAPIPTPGTKSMDHYVLFWARDGYWARDDWLNANNYIGAFRPSAGFSADHAALAEYVTIIGGSLGVPERVEDWLKGQGCKVERIAGKDEADTKKMLDDLASEGRRFQGFDG
jgi:hypothetical protein